MPDIPQNVFKDIRVLDLSRYLPGGYATQPLADWGADVLKVEDTGLGDLMRHDFPMHHGISYYVTALCRNKRSISLNLKDEESVKIFHELAKDADIIVESFRPGVTKKLGIDYETIRAINPRIIYVSLSAFGQNDERSISAQHDLNMQATAGYLSVNHGSTTPLPVVDLATAMVANQSMLAALLNRNLTGEGAYVDISMFDCFVWWNSLLDSRFHFNHSQLTRADLDYPAVAYNVYKTSDGGRVAVGALEDKFWDPLCDTLGLSQATREAKLKRRWEAPDAFIEMERVFISRTAAEWRQWAESNDVCSAVVIDKAEAISNIVETEPNTINYVDFPDIGRVLQTNIPHHISSMPVNIADFVQSPRLGQNTHEVLEGLGFSEEQIQALAERGAVKLDTPVDFNAPDDVPLYPLEFGGPVSEFDSPFGE